jgi:hypothetical protein
MTDAGRNKNRGRNDNQVLPICYTKTLAYHTLQTKK